MIDQLLLGLEPASRRRVGEFLAELARRILADAGRAEEELASIAIRREKTAEIRRAAREVTELLLRDVPREEAVAIIAKRIECEPRRLALWWERDEGPKMARRRRDLNIMQLAARGWSNAELGEKFSLSESAVSRVVRRELRQRRRPAYELLPQQGGGNA